MLSAPAEPPTLLEQAQTQFAALQAQAAEAVKNANAKLLEFTGANSNVDLLNTVKKQSETYGAQLRSKKELLDLEYHETNEIIQPGSADQLNQQATGLKTQADGALNTAAGALSTNAAKLLGNDDPAKVDQLQKSFNGALDAAASLRTQLEGQGAQAQATFLEILTGLTQKTLETANSLAQQLDDANKKP